VFGLLKRNADAKGRIGLAFNRDHIALAVVTRESNSALLTRFEVLPVDPAGGTEAICSAVRAAGLPRLPVSVVLNLEDYQLAMVEAPDVPPAELRAAMRWKLKDAIDFRVEEAIIDVFDVPARSRGASGRMMYAVAARRKAVERYAAALASVPSFDVIDVPELCLRNLAARLPGAAGGIAILHLGDTGATVVLVRGSTFYFARQMHFKTTQRVAAASDESAPLDTAAIVLELQRSLDYYESHFDQPPITKIAVAPSGAGADDLVAALKRDTGFEVGALDLSSMLTYAVPVAPEIQNSCLMAAGAAMREEHRSL
jgi:MSHA biogenesis protein MshI